MAFNHFGFYICKCGKKFENSQSFNAHKSGCRIHLGEEKWAERAHLRKSRSDKAISKLKLKYSNNLAEEERLYNLNPKVCPKCGNLIPFNNRDRDYCSSSCANSHKISLETRQKISDKLRANLGLDPIDITNKPKLKLKKLKEYICLFCNQVILSRSGRKFCCSECRKNYYKKQKVNNSCPRPKKFKKFIIKKVKVKLRNNLTCAQAGIPNPGFGGQRPGSGRGIGGWYNGVWCDSQWELAFLVYCLDHGIEIKRNRVGYKYTFKNKEHQYFPDFIVNGTLYEIKGYFKDLDRIKHQAVRDLGIALVVLTFKDLIKVFDYIKNKYNLGKKEVYKLYNNYVED